MYIEPNTTIMILRNVPLDPSYDHTLYYNPSIPSAGKYAQYVYFSSKAKYTLDRQSYQRTQRGFMRVKIQAENLYDCNYIMYQNTAFGNKWFYAFLKSVEYVNNNTSEIEFEIDVMQTWHFDYTLEQCFVEREHSLTDNIGENLIPENVELGDYVSDSINPSGQMYDWVIVVARTATTIGVPLSGGLYGKTYQQCEFKIFEPTGDSNTGIPALEQYLNTINIFNNINAILTIYMMPRHMVYTVAGAIGQVNVKTFQHSEPKSYTSIGSYTPKNNKLFTYPYNFLRVSNLQGQSTDYHYEYFNRVGLDNTVCNFYIICDTSVNPTIVLMPEGYKGLNNTNPNERMILTDFPKCGYAANDFGAKLVQGAIKTAIAAWSGGLASPEPTTTKTTTTTTDIQRGSRNKIISKSEQTQEQTRTTTREQRSPVAGVSEAMAQKMTHPHTSYITGDSTALYNAGYFDFVFEAMHIREEFARCIDEYFTMYGYATNRVKVPNRNARPKFNYVKTANCCIKAATTSGVPCDDAEKICNIYNRGITFWKDADDVGDYTVNNAPIN